MKKELIAKKVLECSCGCIEWLLHKDRVVECAQCGLRPGAEWYFTTDLHKPGNHLIWN